MNAMNLHPEFHARELSVESLATRHFDRVYAFFNAFLDDPAVCLDLAIRSFRDAEECELSTTCIFAKAVARLGGQRGLSVPVQTAPYESNLAWLLNDVGGLRYHEIGQILELNFQEVKERIADVRLSVLEYLAA